MLPPLWSTPSSDRSFGFSLCPAYFSTFYCGIFTCKVIIYLPLKTLRFLEITLDSCFNTCPALPPYSCPFTHGNRTVSNPVRSKQPCTQSHCCQDLGEHLTKTTSIKFSLPSIWNKELEYRSFENGNTYCGWQAAIYTHEQRKEHTNPWESQKWLSR